MSFLILAGSTTATTAEDKKFTGPYVAVEAGLITRGGGKANIYYGGALGFRYQTDSNVVFGIEGSFAKANIDRNPRIWTASGIAGYAFGSSKNNLLFAGGGAHGRKDSHINYKSLFATAGYEHAINETLSFRLKANYYIKNYYGATAGLVIRF